MKKSRLAVAAFALVATWPGAAGAHRHEPREVVKSFVAYWNEHRIDDMAGLFDGEADYYQPFGSYAKGVDAIRKLLQGTPFAELGRLTANAAPVRERRVNEQLALVEWEARFEGRAEPSVLLVAVVVPRRPARGPGPEWSFAALRMIAVTTEAGRR
jgi:hypothetical protein